MKHDRLKPPSERLILYFSNFSSAHLNKCDIALKGNEQNLMEKKTDNLARTTREHQASDDNVVSSDIRAQTHAHTQNSKTAGQTSQLSASPVTWAIR